MNDQSGIAPLALPRDAVTQLRDVLDQLLRTCTCDHGPDRHDVDGSCQSCNCPAAGYCPHCGSGDAGPTPEAYERQRRLAEDRADHIRRVAEDQTKLRKRLAEQEDETMRQHERAVRFQTRIDNARHWARTNLDEQQQTALLGILRGDGEPAPHSCSGCRGIEPETCLANPHRLPNPDGICPSRCDNDCDASCHEGHEIPRRRRHQPEDCPSTVRAEACCVCGGGPVAYRNYRQQPFCLPCSGCECGRQTAATPHAEGCPALAFAARDTKEPRP